MRSSCFATSLLILTLFSVGACSHGTHPPYHSKLAHKQLVEFAPGVISTESQFEINTVFNQSGTKVIFARCDNDFNHCTMMESEFHNGQWGEGVVMPFSGEYLDADPYYNEDYTQLYYISKRPITSDGKPQENLNLWRVSLSDGQWGEPEYLSKLSSDAHDLYPSFNSAGDLYFPSFRNDQRLMYVARKKANGFAAPEIIPANVYGEDANVGDSAVSRDGKSIIFSISGRADSKGKGDLYISHLKNGEWTIAKSLGNVVNSADHEFTPIMSPDGKYLFFTRIENGLGKLYQVHKSLLNW